MERRGEVYDWFRDIELGITSIRDRHIVTMAIYIIYRGNMYRCLCKQMLDLFGMRIFKSIVVPDVSCSTGWFIFAYNLTTLLELDNRIDAPPSFMKFPLSLSLSRSSIYLFQQLLAETSFTANSCSSFYSHFHDVSAYISFALFFVTFLSKP